MEPAAKGSPSASARPLRRWGHGESPRRINKSEQLKKIEANEIGRIQPACSRDRMAQYWRVDLNTADRLGRRQRFDFPFRTQPHDLAKTRDEYRRMRHHHGGRIACVLAVASRHAGTSSTSGANLACCIVVAAMPNFYSLIRPFLSRLPAETANALSILRSATWFRRRFRPPEMPALPTPRS